jgi:hypothetical protein
MKNTVSLLLTLFISFFARAELPAATPELLLQYDRLIDTAMKSELAIKLDLPRCDQIGLVVENFDQAVEHFEPLLGEFTILEPGSMTYDFRGEPIDVDMSVAVIMHDDLQIELIGVNSGASPHSEFLQNRGEGVQHLRFHVDSVEDVVKGAEALGYRYIWGRNYWFLGAVGYLEKEGLPYYIELIDMPGFLLP